MPARLGLDVDIVSKQTVQVLQLFRPALRVVHEDVRRAARELALAVLGAITGQPAKKLQSLSLPDENRPA